MCNDSTYFLALTLCIVGAFSFVVGRFYERADRWLKDWDAQRRATKAALAVRDARFALPRKKTPARERLVAIGREIVSAAKRSRPVAAWDSDAVQ
jgi:hypothetical protein